MKTFLRKVKLSFLAMLCGWIACNIAWWLGAVPSMDASAIQHLDIRQTGLFALMVGIYTAIVVLMAWLVIFLPVDLLVPNTSRLREPKTAALCGFFAAFTIVAVMVVYAAWNDVMRLGPVDGISAAFSLAALPYALGTCATGCVSAFTRSLMGSSNLKPSP